MNRAWLTALTLAGVAGSAGAAFANVVATPEAAATPDVQVNPQVNSVNPSAAFAAAAVANRPAQSTTYQLSGVGTITLSVRPGVLTVGAITTVPAWSVQAISAPGASVTVQLAAGTQVVTFRADLVRGTVTVALSNSIAPEAPTTAPPAQVVAAPPATNGRTTKQTVKPATPTTSKPVVTPKVVTTTAPSGGEHESEPNDD